MTSAFPSDLKPNSVTGKAGGGLVDTGNSSFLTDFDKTGPGTIDTDEVDPVAEAEVYIAYGRDAQAEEILKEAMSRDKNRHEIPLKLLEIYHARKSATAFETVAKELRARRRAMSSPVWLKAAAMGAQIDPANPLYGGAAGAARCIRGRGTRSEAQSRLRSRFRALCGRRGARSGIVQLRPRPRAPRRRRSPTCPFPTTCPRSTSTSRLQHRRRSWT